MSDVVRYSMFSAPGKLEQDFVLAADYDALEAELAQTVSEVRIHSDACAKACNHAVKLEAELQALNAAHRWIPFNERMPEGVNDVQLYCADTREQFVGFRARNGLYQFAQDRHGEGIVCRPSHWMPLATAPQEDKSHD